MKGFAADVTADVITSMPSRTYTCGSTLQTGTTVRPAAITCAVHLLHGTLEGISVVPIDSLLSCARSRMPPRGHRWQTCTAGPPISRTVTRYSRSYVRAASSCQHERGHIHSRHATLCSSPACGGRDAPFCFLLLLLLSVQPLQCCGGPPCSDCGCFYVSILV